jgi:hypothetical protein
MAGDALRHAHKAIDVPVASDIVEAQCAEFFLYLCALHLMDRFMRRKECSSSNFFVYTVGQLCVNLESRCTPAKMLFQWPLITGDACSQSAIIAQITRPDAAARTDMALDIGTKNVNDVVPAIATADTNEFITPAKDAGVIAA